MLSRDFLYAARTLRKSPVFTITAAVTIALGIGAGTAIFSVTNAVLLRPLPYKDPTRLVIACGDMLKRNVKDFPLSNVDYLDIHNQARGAFEDFAALLTFRGTVPRTDGTLERTIGAVVSPNFFRLMGQPIVAGRDFTETDGTPQPPPAAVPAGAPAPAPVRNVAILSYEFWQRRFGGDPSILGRPLPGLQAQNTPIPVGVAAQHVQLLFPADANVETSPDLWICGRIPYDVANRNNVQWRVIGRMKDGVTLERAQAEADAVSAQIRQGNAIKQTAGFHIRLDPIHAHLVAEVRPAILALMGAAIFLLLIACANVANLLLVRASLRARELAVRTALGASWWSLARQILTEALLLAGLGGIAGVGLAWLGIHELRAIAPAELPRLDSIAIDPAVLGFTLLAALGSAALFGMAPVYSVSRADFIDKLRAAGRNAGLMGGGALRNSVAVAQVALAFVLLIGSGLMFRSFLELQRVDAGFDPHNLLTFQLQGGGGGGAQTPEQRAAFQQNIRSRLGAIPGVLSVAAAFPLPLAGGFSPIRWGTEQALGDTSKFQAADLQFALPGYFETMKVPVLAGRTFNEADNGPKRLLMMIDQELAAKAFPGQSAVGKRLLVRINTPEAQWMEIIGVVAHQRESSLAQAGREQVFVADGYIGSFANNWVLRTSGAPAGFAPQVRAVIASLGPQFVVADLRPMDSLVRGAQAGTRFSLLLIGVFASIAAILAAVGLYGVLSTVVRQRTAEIGVRMALGAAPRSIFSLVVGQGLRLSIAGVVLGLAAAFALTRAMTSMLVGVKPTDPATYTGVAIFFFAITSLASWLPAWRAAALDPTVALREE
ncbi:MAG TPA: ABC transporter permease [Bryobacteraceae bacterium]|nr:ABC transporter permease [Bryobacteraceae bacterium]